ncbi:MAG TPA: hypothetical protein VF621_15450 [Pyrinomonadaceae bacterium]
MGRHARDEGGAARYERAAFLLSAGCRPRRRFASPRQPAAPSDRSAAGRTMRRLTDLTATLTFVEDGLHAVLTVRRK